MARYDNGSSPGGSVGRARTTGCLQREKGRSTMTSTPSIAVEHGTAVLDERRLERLDAYWRATNYLTVGQIYLRENPLLREPLRPEHIKPRLLGHWGTSPGLNLLYVHLNRLIQDTDTDMIFLAGPGHGGPAVLANVYLEGTYTEIYPAITQDEAGMLR